MLSIVVGIRKKLESLRKMDSSQIIMHSVATALEKLLKVPLHTYIHTYIYTYIHTFEYANTYYILYILIHIYLQTEAFNIYNYIEYKRINYSYECCVMYIYV